MNKPVLGVVLGAVLGAVDGLTRRAEPTVDGLPLPAHIGMLELLRTMESPRGTGGLKK